MSGAGGNQALARYFADQIHVAMSACHRGAHEQALTIWRDMNMRYPGSLTSEKALNLLVGLGCYDEAEALMREGRRRYPRYRSLFAKVSARNAHSRGHLENALQRCEL